MRKLMFAMVLLVFSYTGIFSQPPSGFKLVKGESPAGRDDYYTNGRIKIFHDVVQEFGDYGASEWIKSVYKGFTTIKTKDGLVVGIGKENGKNVYIVFKGQEYFMATSSKDDKEFSDISKYILRKVREVGTSFLN